MTQIIEAIPTTYSGIRMRSRMEARFAEWMDESDVEWDYEKKFPGSQGYVSDFFLPAYGLHVEIKPESKLRETDIFRQDVGSYLVPWICVDSSGRGKWRIIAANAAFSNSNKKIFFGSKEITFLPDRVCVQVNRVDFFIAEEEKTEPKPDLDPPVSNEALSNTAREHFAKMRALLD